MMVACLSTDSQWGCTPSPSTSARNAAFENGAVGAGHTNAHLPWDQDPVILNSPWPLGKSPEETWVSTPTVQTQYDTTNYATQMWLVPVGEIVGT